MSGPLASPLWWSCLSPQLLLAAQQGKGGRFLGRSHLGARPQLKRGWELFTVLQKGHHVRGSPCASGYEKPSAPGSSPVPCSKKYPHPCPPAVGTAASPGPSFCFHRTGRDRATSLVPRTVDTWGVSGLRDLLATSVLEVSSHGEALVDLSGDRARARLYYPCWLQDVGKFWKVSAQGQDGIIHSRGLPAFQGLVCPVILPELAPVSARLPGLVFH